VGVRRGISSVVVAAAIAASSLCAPAGALASSTPHLDYVARYLRARAPGTEGKVWWISYGNTLPAGWLLQTPNCWGRLTCGVPPPGGDVFLQRITALVSNARVSVDFAGLFPPPNGRFEQAIIKGLRKAKERGYRPTIRILVGTPPANFHRHPTTYIARLSEAYGGGLPIQAAYMSTARRGPVAISWDHSKLLDIDGRSAIIGGTNWWSPDYLDTQNPVNDVSMVVSGPAAADASKFENLLWSWTCAHRHNPLYVYFSARSIQGCLTHASTLPITATGDVPIMVVGRLGNGIEVPGRAGRESPPIARPPYHGNGCLVPDNIFTANTDTNNNRYYEYRNSGEDALRALIGSAHHSIFISQQDLLSCAPVVHGVRLNVEARFDERIFAALGTKVAHGVPIKIVVSNQGAAAGYSNEYSLADLANTLTHMVAAQRGIRYPQARALVCRDVGLAAVHNGPSPTWPDGKRFANHAKIVDVDNQAFYIGSENLYPARLQELGLIVESRSAAKTLKTGYLDPLWRWSRRYALIDPQGAKCGSF
jgi:phosphatidylserine/phosphatidylglycerophosphate/cardiolipin synthase-like enzyme